MNKERLAAFSDAIIAIAATIMVLDLHLPAEPTIQSLAKEWPVFLAYVISFVLIYIVWLNYNNLFQEAHIISVRTFLLNGLWIFCVTLVPFTTNWIGANPTRTWPNVVYDLIILLWSLMFQLMERSIKKDNPDLVIKRFSFYNNYYSAFIIYIFGIVMSFFAASINIILITIAVFSSGISGFRHYRSVEKQN